MALEVLKPTEEELSDKAVSQFYEAFYSCIENAKSPLGDFLFNELQQGEKTIYNKTVRETKIFDGNFLDVVIGAYPSLLKICRDPKKTLAYMQEVVAMEKAKKVDSESIRHLASHTQYIRDINEQNEVIPSKILSTYAEDNIGIYENRFIKSLINRVIVFLDTRLKLMDENLESISADEIRYKNNIKLSHRKIDLEMNIKISNEILDETQKARELFDKTKNALDKYRALKGTGLYQAVAKLKDVVPPIMKTNIILHNPDFKIAYNLWLYIDRTTEVGYNVQSDEKTNDDDDVILNDFNHIGVFLINDLMHQRGIQSLEAFEGEKNVRELKHDDITKYELEPKDIKLSHQEISEYLLSRISEIFEEKYKESLSQGLSYEMSVKRVFREMIDVLNRIYPNLFGVNTEDMKKTPELLEILKRKQRVMKLIREQKQIDLNKMDRETQTLDTNIKNLEDYLKRQEERQKERERKEAIRLEKLRLQEEKRKAREEKRKEAERLKAEKERIKAEQERLKEEERLKKEEEERLKKEAEKRTEEQKEELLVEPSLLDEKTKETSKPDDEYAKLKSRKSQTTIKNKYLEDLDEDVVLRYSEDELVENNRENFAYDEDIDNDVIIRFDENEVIENILVKEQAAKKAKALARSNIKDSKGISKDKTKKVPKGRKSIYIDDVKRGHKPLRKNRVNKHAH
ncbi:MAG: hypothetical protein BHW10_06780 [Clostridium sp. CAG:307_30_263]|nr:MAG: hypothetical protein BHW10_06780 [Clostridium sp. CAG:307_30_263]